MNHVVSEIENLGLTKQRQAVLQVIRESEKHLTANEVFEDARRVLPGISFATVYNSLNYLKQEGLIGEVRFGNATRFDRTLERHDHALCTVCGQLVDIDVPVERDLVNRAVKPSKFKAESIEVVVRGRCPECT